MFEIEKLDMRVKYTREWTFEALYKILETKEYDKINISEIINKAGISRATFYRNFKNKDDIVKLKVKMFFETFFLETYNRYKKIDHLDETYLINSFFNSIGEHEKLISTVIKTNLEYLMENGILAIINMQKDRFYNLVKQNEGTDKYTIEIVASSAWTLVSKWIKTGKKENVPELVEIYLNTFKSVYIALFGDKSELN
jgi:AcrR family transcriptional regulator